jgi:hypothetical protein
MDGGRVSEKRPHQVCFHISEPWAPGARRLVRWMRALAAEGYGVTAIAETAPENLGKADAYVFQAPAAPESWHFSEWVRRRGDKVVIDIEPAKVFVSQNEGLKILETEYITENYAICVQKGNTELLDGINAALAELKESGELQAIIDKYIKAE